MLENAVTYILLNLAEVAYFKIFKHYEKFITEVE